MDYGLLKTGAGPGRGLAWDASGQCADTDGVAWCTHWQCVLKWDAHPWGIFPKPGWLTGTVNFSVCRVLTWEGCQCRDPLV